MSRERGAGFENELLNPEQLRQSQADSDSVEGRQRRAASISPDDNPLIAQGLAEMGIPYPTTPEEWNTVGDEVDRRTAGWQKKIQAADEAHELDQAPIRERRRVELQRLQEELDRLQSSK